MCDNDHMDTSEQKDTDIVKVNIRRKDRKTLRRYAAKHDLTLIDALAILVGNPAEPNGDTSEVRR